MTADPPTVPDVRPFAEIARGPLASVYKAYDAATGEVVLLKAMRPAAAADPERRARFADEARLAATVVHPNVVRVRHATDETLVVDWVEGADLQATLDAHGPMPAALAAFVAAEAARGLAAVHAAGIVHRDVKPANVLLGADGSVRLTDFGLASLAAPTSRFAPGAADALDEVRGTLASLAPEVVQGASATAAADVFALGAVLAHALTGRAPFAAASASDTLSAVLHTDAGAALAADPRVPVALARVAAPLLARDPASRPSATAVAEALDALGPASAGSLAAWLADATVPVQMLAVPDAEGPAWPGEPRGRPAAPTRRRARALVGLAGAVLLAGLALVLAARRPPTPDVVAGRDAPPPVTLQAPAATEGAPTSVEDQPPGSSGDPVTPPLGMPSPAGEAPPEESRAVDPPAAPRPAPAGAEPPGTDGSSAPPRAEAPAAPGALAVVVEPWAVVRVDGRVVGTTPVEAIPLPAGTYEVAFENPDFPTYRVRVRVPSGETVRTAVSLWSLVARVTLDVAPWAEVAVDGRPWATVPPPPPHPLVLTPGAHVLTFTHPTLGRREVALHVAAGETRTVRVRMTEPVP